MPSAAEQSEQSKRQRLLYQRLALETAQSALSLQSEELNSQCASWTSDISRLRNEVEKLREQKDRATRLRNDAETQLGVLSKVLQGVLDELEVLDKGGLPMKNFPPDILRMIFLEAAAGDSRFRWVAMGVCRDWRSIAQLTPSLWSRLQIKFAHHNNAMLKVAREALSFGGQYPLQLHLLFCLPPVPPRRSRDASPRRNPPRGWSDIESSDHDSDRDSDIEDWDEDGWRHVAGRAVDNWNRTPNYEFAWDYVDMIAPHLPRCKSLFWQVSAISGDWWTWEACWIARRLDTIVLEHLKTMRIDLLSITLRTGGHHEQAVHKLCRAAPNLTRLSMRNVPWNRLSTTTLHSLDLTDCKARLEDLLASLDEQNDLRILKLYCTQTSVSLPPGSVITDERWQSEPSRAPRIVKLPALTYLFYQSDRVFEEESETLLSRLSCPRLQRAIIKGDVWGQTLSDMVTFLLRSPLLEELGLTLMSSDLLRPVFQSLPSVREFVGMDSRTLGWGSIPGYQEFFSAALVPGALPSLQWLSLLDFCPLDMLIPWINDRNASGIGTPLKYFSTFPEHLYNDSPHSPDDGVSWREQLQELSVEVKPVGWIDDVYWPYGKKDWA
ncbi:hypothetical protein CALVIDRAFT_118147 [Calocera viscosa TUFC12733]|uniref:Uncharacterized protein n=1 Tax=Calocera viscosa (strain TUFC12733) TaxID=1330018 RepID=A0A167M9D7_CALVF|nr:hypothetical protein CALVIDRAFT_118147 [Calocera viscosa TUFC12733]